MNERTDSRFKERLKEYVRYPDMKELIARLREVPDSYVGFVSGVVAYTSRSPEGLKAVKNYMDTTENLTTSDILRIVSEQPDFPDCCVGGRFENRKGESHE